MIDFARGHPNSCLLPSEDTQLVLEKLCRLATEEGAQPNDAILNALQYGKDEGNDDFLDELRSFLSRHSSGDDYGEFQAKVDKDASIDKGNSLFVTSGVSHGIELLCATQTRPGDLVLVERPTYFLVGGIFCSHNLVIRGLPMQESTGGVDVDKLIEFVENGTMDVPRMIYVIPTHQNPTGHTMCIEDRIKLVSFAYRHGVLIVSDDVYHILDWRRIELDGPRPARMACLSELIKDEVQTPSSRLCGCVSVSSFTKIFAPGVRCGWIEGSKDIIGSISNYGYIQSQGGCAPFVGEIMRLALETRIADDVLKKLTIAYKRRAEKICTALSVESRIQIVNRPIGGYFIWIKFPSNVNSEQFLEFCNGRVKFMLGVRCDIAGGDICTDTNTVAEKHDRPFTSHARLCFADLDEDVLHQGVQLLIACFQEYKLKQTFE